MISGNEVSSEPTNGEVGFALWTTTALQPDPRLPARAVGRFLEAQIARDPLDLRQHARRVWLAVDNADSPALFGAMVDLFLALGAKGRNLRSAMLGLAASHLAEEDLAYLHSHLEHGLSSREMLPFGVRSVLDRGFVGVRDMVRREKAHGPDAADPLKEAISLLNDGDVDAARELLEKTLLDDPGSPLIEAELLEIYRRSNDGVRMHAMRDRLLENGVDLSPAWRHH